MKGKGRLGDSPGRRIDRDAPKCSDVAETLRCLKVGDVRPIGRSEAYLEAGKEQ